MPLALIVSLAIAQAATTWCDFEQPRELTLIGEHLQPGSRVALSTEQAHSGRQAVRLDYEFIAEPGGLQYAGFHTELTADQPLGRVFVWVLGDGTAQSLRLRLLDAGGETHQFTLGSTGFEGWRQLTARIGEGGECWGGDGNGRLDPPLRFDSLLVDQVTRPARGTLWFDDLAYTPYEPPVDPLGDLPRPAYTGDRALVTLAMAEPGRVFALGEQPRVVVNAELDETLARDAQLAVLGPDGQPLAAADGAGPWRDLQLPLEKAGLNLDLPPLQHYGLYRVVLQWSTLAAAGRATTSFCALPPMPAQRDLETNLFGACFHFAQGKGQLPRSYDLLARIGGRWVRDEYGWGAVEKQKGQYEFSQYGDDYVAGLRAAGLRGFYIFDYGNSLYDDGLSPTSAEAQAAFGEYAYQLTRRYRDQVKHWEIFNEANGGFWKPEPDPEAYARLCQVTYAAAKRADPQAFVVGMATAGVDLSFIERVFAAGGTTMDAVSIHPYRYPTPPEDGGLLADLRKTRAVMAKHGLGEKPLWLTEIGWPNQRDGRGVSEEQSGDYLVRMFTLARSEPHMGPIFWYDFQNDGTNPTYNEDNFGLINLDYTPKQPFVAAAMMNRVLLDKQFRRDLALPYPAWGHEYEADDGRRTLVLWSTPLPAELTLETGPGELELSDGRGRLETVTPAGGALTVTVGETPLLVSGQWTEARVTLQPPKH